MKLTQAQIEVLCWARKTGAVFPFKRQDGGGSRRRMALRMVKAGLLALPFGLSLTTAGLSAIENYDDLGRRKSRMTPEALTELGRRHKAGEDMRGLFSLKTGKPIRQSANLTAINAELAGMTALQSK